MVIIWALVGVIVASGEYNIVKYSAIGAIVLIVVGLVVAVSRKKPLIYGR
jgi:hypothetical protein